MNHRQRYERAVEAKQNLQNPTLDRDFDDMRFALVEVMTWVSSWNPEFIYEERWREETEPFVRAVIERTAS